MIKAITAEEIILNPRTNQEWLDALREPVSDEAIIDLRNILIRGLRAALYNRAKTDLDALSEDFAQEALMKILKSLDTFRGESRFTTWAQKIAIHVAFTELRRRRWKDISLQDVIETYDGDEYTPAILTDPDVSPEMKVTQSSMLDIVRKLINEELTERQRTALLAVMQAGVPMDQVAKKLGTNRNALYKLIHDTRKRLQRRLLETTGISAQEAMALFERK
jgi:RNA polymerase sigma-70 factor (ECF subfamily)